jgi:hypothetical protein
MVSGVPVSIDPALSDRACPKTFQWGDDRLAALYDIADAWPARVRVDDGGTVTVLPPLSGTPDPVVTLTDGQRGTVVSAPRRDTRDGVPNVLVVRSSATDDPARAPVQAVAVVASGPLTPDTYGEVVEFFSTPLAVTLSQCKATAETMLATRTRPSVQRVVTCAPDPRVDTDDPVLVVRGADTDLGWVIGFDLPLTLDGGAMTVTVGVSQ